MKIKRRNRFGSASPARRSGFWSTLPPALLVCFGLMFIASGFAQTNPTTNADVDRQEAIPFVPQTYGLGGSAPGINKLPATVELPDGLSPAMATEIEQKLSHYRALGLQQPPSASIGLAPDVNGPAQYPFFPHAGTLGRDIYISNFVDMTQGHGPPLAWDCSARTYSGHTGNDSIIRSFHEQAIGLPVFAALDGLVVGWREDAFDMNLQCASGAPVNYILLDHGNQHYTIYLHFRQFSIPSQLKVVGKFVSAGTQLGLTGSSGCSSWPHLHFESWFGGLGVLGLPGPNLQIQWQYIYEPFAGPCNNRTSGWLPPTPYTGLQGYAKDVALSASPFPNATGNGFVDPYDLNQRTATFTTDQIVNFRPELINLPPGSTYDITFTRPDGLIHFRDANTFGNSSAINFPVGPWWYVYNLIPGTWRIDLIVNGTRLPATFFQVVTSPSQIVNHAPRTPSVTIEPANPRGGDVLFCRVSSSITDRDPDTDVVSYRYEWQVNGTTRRTISSSAGLADALPAEETLAGSTVTCSVTASDGRLTGSTATTSRQIAGLPTIEFTSSAMGVLESAGAIPVTVMRTGNLSGSASVDYATANGTASDRSDYTAALGTLYFAPNESSKSFQVLITDDVLLESPETINLQLSNFTGAGSGATANAVITITSNDSTSGPSPVKDASFNSGFFVRQHYSDFLNRAPDADGFAFWKNQLDECTTAACRELRRINGSAAFFLSIEFQQTGYLVYRLHQAAFNTGERLPLRTFLPQTQEIGRGVVVGNAGWDLLIEANKQAFVDSFVQRQEFIAAYPLTMSAAQFVDALNANTKDPQNASSTGALTTAQRNQLVSDLSAGLKTRAQVLRSVAENSVFQQRQFNKAFVLMQYFGYLRRNPNDAPNSDFSGYNFWLGKLNQFNGDFQSADMVKAFLDSAEYQLRFGL
jgi:murein DD-endopeptidase MepM/ murein hydrolase activator NlpD